MSQNVGTLKIVRTAFQSINDGESTGSTPENS